MTRMHDAAPETIFSPAPHPDHIVDDPYGCVTVRDLLRVGQEMLAKSGIANAVQETRWLLQAGLGVSQLTLHVDGARVLTREDRERSMALLRRRANLEPLQYILVISR